MLKQLLWEQYGIAAGEIRKSTVGAGSDTYFITCGTERFVVKFPAESEINQPDLEPALCAYLLEKGIPVCRFLKNRQGEYLSKDVDGRTFHVQQFIKGTTFDLNCAPDWFLSESARMLGKIHKALKGYTGLPIGIGEDFFRYMTPRNALISYKKSLEIAEKEGAADIIADLQYRIDLMTRIPEWELDLKKLTCTNTHGDYFISQIICGQTSIRAVIDWTTACIHPAIWEIMRSYVYASPRCIQGAIDMDEFMGYVAAYMTESVLTQEDICAMVPLFRYQLAVCDYYGQYYSSTADNRHIYLYQAEFSTKLLRWFDSFGAELEEKLRKSFVMQHK